MTPDLINGAFEFLAGLMILNHCRALYRDKMVRGVSTLSTTFFFSWGLWNIFYYPNLDQMWSFYGGLFVVTANSLYVGAQVYYRRRERTQMIVRKFVSN